MKSKRQINIWFGILVIEFIEKMHLNKVIPKFQSGFKEASFHRVSSTPDTVRYFLRN